MKIMPTFSLLPGLGTDLFPREVEQTEPRSNRSGVLALSPAVFISDWPVTCCGDGQRVRDGADQISQLSRKNRNVGGGLT
jgi:hypothetical protein